MTDDTRIALVATIFLDIKASANERERWQEALRRRIRHWAEDGAPVVRHFVELKTESLRLYPPKKETGDNE